jgi:4a-hydroxytetrahydrobiopterin dehydratase
MPTLLDDQLVTDAMANLEEWSGDAQRISRTVRVADVDALVAAVSETADVMDHHPEVSRDGDAVTFTLWTHSAGGVTELDIALASRIDDLVLTTQHLQRDAKGNVHEVTDDASPTEGDTVTAQPNFPTDGQTTPSRPEESATGDPGMHENTDAAG